VTDLHVLAVDLNDVRLRCRQRLRDGRTTEERIERARLQETVREVFGIGMPAGPFVCDRFAEQAALF